MGLEEPQRLVKIARERRECVMKGDHACIVLSVLSNVAMILFGLPVPEARSHAVGYAALTFSGMTLFVINTRRERGCGCSGTR